MKKMLLILTVFAAVISLLCGCHRTQEEPVPVSSVKVEQTTQAAEDSIEIATEVEPEAAEAETLPLAIDEAQIYTDYLLNGGYDDLEVEIGHYMIGDGTEVYPIGENTHLIRSALYDVDQDGCRELFMGFTENETINKDAFNAEVLLSIHNGAVNVVDASYTMGRSGWGSLLHVFTNSVTGEALIGTNFIYRDAGEALERWNLKRLINGKTEDIGQLVDHKIYLGNPPIDEYTYVRDGYVEVYMLNDEFITEEEYDSFFKDLHELSQNIIPYEQVSYDQPIHDSAHMNAVVKDESIHGYELHIGGYDWKEAQKLAHDAGGKLVTFDSLAEYDHVLQLIINSDMEKVYFSVGGQRKTDTKEFYWLDAKGNFYGDDLNGSDFWGASMWQKGEPSLVWEEDTESYLNLFYDSKEGRWGLNDVRDHLEYPTNPDRIGFIIEFE